MIDHIEEINTLLAVSANGPVRNGVQEFDLDVLRANLLNLLAKIEKEGEPKLRHEYNFLYRWVERGLFDITITPMMAIEVMAHHPAAPWSQGVWDCTHMPYANKFYQMFPDSKPGK